MRGTLMASLRPGNLMTTQEFFEWANYPENRDRHYELDRGKVVEVPLSGQRHGFVCASVSYILNSYAHQRRRGYACCNNTGLILERDPDTVLGPDVMLYDEMQRYDE